MKRKLLSVAILAMGLSANAQVLKQQDFETLNVGNISTDVTGTTAGQGGIYVYAAEGNPSTLGNVNHYKIANDATKGKIIEVSMPTVTTGNYIYEMLNWNSRTQGNNIITFTQWLYTGSSASADPQTRFAFFGETGIIGGYNYNHNTRAIRGYIYGDLNNIGTPSNFTLFLLTGSQDKILPENTWVELRYGYDTITGDHSWYIVDQNINGGYTYMSTAGNPAEYNIIPIKGQNMPTGTTTLKYDSYKIQAVNNNNLSTDKQELTIGEIKVYPNPANDVINVSSTQGVIQHYAIVDLTGKTVKFGEVSSLENLSVNIQDLASGAYIMNIKTDKAIKNLKFVKK